MESIRAYLLAVIGVALICSIANTLSAQNAAAASVTKLISGLILMLTIIAPFTKFEIFDYSFFLNSLSFDAQSAVEVGQYAAQNETAEIIKQQVEAYILDKGKNMGLDISINVTLNNDTPPTPESVTISGTASPYAKTVLMEYIETTLSITKENQIWT